MMSPLTWDTLDWNALDRLRDTFLAGVTPGVSYWTSPSDLANYDFTFAQRIGWKWDAVLRELQERRWNPSAATVLDWGCGSGIAGRRVVECFGPERFQVLRLFDRSSLATDFAVTTARLAFPGLRVESVDTSWLASQETVGLLVISHVLGELDEAGGQSLRRAIDRAEAVLWVEPGTHADSRTLIAMREALRDQLVVVAPCTHQAPCGLRTPENERHWCHHFAPPPAGIMADSNWVRFAQRAGIDLRSLPYSFLVLERWDAFETRNAGQLPFEEGWSRIIGVPRRYKAVARILSCQTSGVRELELQKRDLLELFKAIKDGKQEALYRWELSGGRIKAATTWASR